MADGDGRESSEIGPGNRPLDACLGSWHSCQATKVSVQYSIMQASVLKAGQRGRVWLAGLIGGRSAWKGLTSLSLSSVSGRPIGRPRMPFGTSWFRTGLNKPADHKEKVVNPVSLCHGLDPQHQDR
jgi:hypothetical protein